MNSVFIEKHNRSLSEGRRRRCGNKNHECCFFLFSSSRSVIDWTRVADFWHERSVFKHACISLSYVIKASKSDYEQLNWVKREKHRSGSQKYQRRILGVVSVVGDSFSQFIGCSEFHTWNSKITNKEELCVCADFWCGVLCCVSACVCTNVSLLIISLKCWQRVDDYVHIISVTAACSFVYIFK